MAMAEVATGKAVVPSNAAADVMGGEQVPEVAPSGESANELVSGETAIGVWDAGLTAN